MDDEFPTMFDHSTCTRKGLCPVTKIRHQEEDPLESHSLYYELHGTGTKRIVFIMGLNSSCFAWAGQVLHFSGKSDEYSVLVFDNRGVGNSGYPRGPYTTAGMAADVVALLDFVGWTNDREVNVVGISLGGMIAQELATLIPNRISSLFLAVTTPGGRPWNNFPPWKGIVSLARLLPLSDINEKTKVVMPMLFPEAWLDQKSEDDSNKTNRQVQAESFIRRLTIARQQRLMGHLSQMIAGLTHHVSPSRLTAISKSIPKVVILTGDQDHLVDPRHSLEIKAHMPEAELVQWEGTGHGIHAQWPRRFNSLLEKTFAEGEARSRYVERM